MHGGVSANRTAGRDPLLGRDMLHDWGTLSDAGPLPLIRNNELAVYLLTPGFSRAYHQQALAVSNATLWKYMQWAQDLGHHDTGIGQMVAANLGSITLDDGLLMARRRGRAQLPYWSRLAVCECMQIHRSATTVAGMFGCSKRTIYNVQRGSCLTYHPLTGDRQLTATQAAPPAARRWKLTGATTLARGAP